MTLLTVCSSSIVSMSALVFLGKCQVLSTYVQKNSHLNKQGEMGMHMGCNGAQRVCT